MNAIDLFAGAGNISAGTAHLHEIERFASKIVMDGACWRWAAGLMGGGYGQFHYRSRPPWGFGLTDLLGGRRPERKDNMAERKKPADIVPRLLEWQRIYDQWQAQYEALQALTKCGPEAPIALAMGQMWDAYSNAVAREVGDDNEWLDWYCWENDMGAKGLVVQSTLGKEIKVTTIAHLARVMCW